MKIQSIHNVLTLDQYQDKWENGRLVRKGYRECSLRYKIVHDFCLKFTGPFTVCDIGANICYFGTRLTEDFPQCIVEAYEGDPTVVKTVRSWKLNTRLHLHGQHLNLAELSEVGHFDVVLAFSILHHVVGFEHWVDGLRKLSSNVIVELATNVDRVTGGIVLGYGQSHLGASIKRPIMLLG